MTFRLRNGFDIHVSKLQASEYSQVHQLQLSCAPWTTISRNDYQVFVGTENSSVSVSQYMGYKAVTNKQRTIGIIIGELIKYNKSSVVLDVAYLLTHKSWRRQRVADILHRHLLMSCGGIEVHKRLMITSVEDYATQGFLCAQGYHCTKQLNDHYQDKEGDKTALIYQRDLTKAVERFKPINRFIVRRS